MLTTTTRDRSKKTRQAATTDNSGIATHCERQDKASRCMSCEKTDVSPEKRRHNEGDNESTEDHITPQKKKKCLLKTDPDEHDYDEMETETTAAMINDILAKRLQAVYYRQAYRMTPNHFWRLYKLLSPNLNSKSQTSVALRLSTAIRYLAGGDAAADHNIPDLEIIESYLWEVVDAIHDCSALDIEFPSSQREQRDVALGFEMIKSDIGIPSCAGCLGSMILWIEKPENDDGNEQKFFNHSANRYGLQLQAICDHDGRFIHASIDHPGGTSDLVAFSKSELHRSLQMNGFLADDLALFGKKSYAPNPFVITPFSEPNLSEAQRDFNTYHKQLADIIDSTFSSVVQRWSLLSRPLPRRFGLAKQRALALAILKLHNFCLLDTEPMLPGLAKDLVYNFDHGAILPREDMDAYHSELDDSNSVKEEDTKKTAIIHCCQGPLNRSHRLREALLQLI